MEQFNQHELELLYDAVSLELFDLDVTCNRALLLMALNRKIEKLLEVGHE